MSKAQDGQQLPEKAAADTDISCSSGCATKPCILPNEENLWRTYSATYLNPTLVGKTGYNFLSVSFMMYADSNLDFLIYRENCISSKYFRTSAELTFRLPYSISLERFNELLSKVKNLERVFTWIPSSAVLLGRRVCYQSTAERYPFYKINAVTNDDGKIDSLLVTVFDGPRLQRKDIKNEVEFYLSRKGTFEGNPDAPIYFPDTV